MKAISMQGKAAKDRIEKELAYIQRSCVARTITYADIERALNDVEKRIGVPRCKLDGTEVVVDVNGDNFPSAYKYTPYSTVFRAVNKSGKWVLLDVYRAPSHRFNQRVKCTLSDTTKKSVLERFCCFTC